jgi:hypothetical protein
MQSDEEQIRLLTNTWLTMAQHLLNAPVIRSLCSRGLAASGYSPVTRTYSRPRRKSDTRISVKRPENTSIVQLLISSRVADVTPLELTPVHEQSAW